MKSSKKHLFLGPIPLSLMALSGLIYCLYARNVIDSEMAYSCNEKDMCQEEVLLLRGDIPRNSAFRTGLTLVWTKLTKTNTVCMQSNGGVFADALNVAQTINVLGMDTCLALNYKLKDASATKVPGECKSSCTWVILGGRHRILKDDRLFLGFHASRDRGGKPVPSDLLKLKTEIKSLEVKAEDSEKLQLLAEWAFTQGHTPATTNCTASEVQGLYPYFTDLPSGMRARPQLSCGLISPDDMRKRLNSQSI